MAASAASTCASEGWKCSECQRVVICSSGHGPRARTSSCSPGAVVGASGIQLKANGRERVHRLATDVGAPVQALGMGI